MTLLDLHRVVAESRLCTEGISSCLAIKERELLPLVGRNPPRRLDDSQPLRITVMQSNNLQTQKMTSTVDA